MLAEEYRRRFSRHPRKKSSSASQDVFVCVVKSDFRTGVTNVVARRLRVAHMDCMSRPLACSKGIPQFLGLCPKFTLIQLC